MVALKRTVLLRNQHAFCRILIRGVGKQNRDTPSLSFSYILLWQPTLYRRESSSHCLEHRTRFPHQRSHKPSSASLTFWIIWFLHIRSILSHIQEGSFVKWDTPFCCERCLSAICCLTCSVRSFFDKDREVCTKPCHFFFYKCNWIWQTNSDRI